MIGAVVEGAWKLNLGRELHATGNSDLFEPETKIDLLPIYDGKNIHQFTHVWSPPENWIDEKAARQRLLGREKDTGRDMDYLHYRAGFREIAAKTNERCLISTVLPRRVFATHKLTLNRPTAIVSLVALCYCTAVFNSFVFDFFVRQRVTTTITVNIVKPLPLPRLTGADARFRPIVERAARLIGITAEYDDLLTEIFGPDSTHQTHGTSTDADRQRLRIEIDALAAQLYELTEEEFAHILTTFPIASASVRLSTHQTYARLLTTVKLA